MDLAIGEGNAVQKSRQTDAERGANSIRARALRSYPSVPWCAHLVDLAQEVLLRKLSVHLEGLLFLLVQLLWAWSVLDSTKLIMWSVQRLQRRKLMDGREW